MDSRGMRDLCLPGGIFQASGSGIAHNEESRLRKLHSCGIIENVNLNDPEFDRLTHLACRLFKVNVVLINYVDENSNVITSKAGSKCDEIFQNGYPRKGSVCTHTVLPDSLDVLVIPDISKDARFIQLSIDLGILFYAGAPIYLDDYKIGVLCVIDTKPRPEGLTTHERMNLLDLAAIVSSLVRERRDKYVNINQERARLVTDLSHNLRTPLQALSLSVSTLKQEVEKMKPSATKQLVDSTMAIGKACKQLDAMVESSLSIVRLLAGGEAVCKTSSMCNLTEVIESIHKLSLCMAQNFEDKVVWDTDQLLSVIRGDDKQDTYGDALQVVFYSIFNQLLPNVDRVQVKLGFEFLAHEIVEHSGDISSGLQYRSGYITARISVPLDSSGGNTLEASPTGLLNFSGVGRMLRDIMGGYEEVPPEQLSRESMGVRFWIPCVTVGTLMAPSLISVLDNTKAKESSAVSASCREVLMGGLDAPRLAAPPVSLGAQSSIPFLLPVLVVEDSVPAQKIVRQMLECIGCVVFVAANGKIGLEMIKKNPYFVVFLDFLMPVKTGLEFLVEWTLWMEDCRWRGESPMNEHTLIVGVSATASTAERVQAHSTGMHFFAPKPISGDTLALVVDSARKYISSANTDRSESAIMQILTCEPSSEYLQTTFSYIKDSPVCKHFIAPDNVDTRNDYTTMAEGIIGSISYMRMPARSVSSTARRLEDARALALQLSSSKG